MKLRDRLKGPAYAVLGNHDSIRMAPSMEAMGIRMLFNECEPIVRDGQRIFLAAVDDPHFYLADDIEKAAAQIPSDAFSILLAHTPEVYDRALAAGFDLMLCGHTHGGQLLPAQWNSDQTGGSFYPDSWVPGRGAMAQWSDVRR